MPTNYPVHVEGQQYGPHPYHPYHPSYPQHSHYPQPPHHPHPQHPHHGMRRRFMFRYPRYRWIFFR